MRASTSPNLDGDDRSFLPPESHEIFNARSARLSPESASVAAIGSDEGPRHDEPAGSVVVLDTERGEVASVTPALQPPPAYLADRLTDANPVLLDLQL